MEPNTHLINFMMIDIQLLKLRYEILNIPLEELAQEIETPVSLLEKEAQINNWKQWWPETPLKLAIEDGVVNSTVIDEQPGAEDGEEYNDDLLSPLEEGAQQFIQETGIRLQVFNLAKEVYLAHKYASFESALIVKARSLVDTLDSAAEIAALSGLLKNLSAKTGASLQIGQDETGLPTVIIRDLTGRTAG